MILFNSNILGLNISTIITVYNYSDLPDAVSVPINTMAIVQSTREIYSTTYLDNPVGEFLYWRWISKA